MWAKPLKSCPALCDPMDYRPGAGLKEPACQCRRCKRHGFNPWVRKIPWRRKWQHTPAFLPGESYGQRSLAGYSPEGHKESDMTEVTEHICTCACTYYSPPGSSVHWDSPGKNTRVGCHFLLQIFFHYGLSQDTEDSSLWYAVGPCCLSTLCIIPHSQYFPPPCLPSCGQPQVCSLCV